MPEPLTLTMTVAGFLGGLVSDVVSNMVAARADKHLLETFLDRRINHDIQQALRTAWRETVDDLFKIYHESPHFRGLSRDDRTLIEERAKIFAAPETVDMLFPVVDDAITLLAANDVVRLFTAQRAVVNRQLIDALERLWFWEGLPESLQSHLTWNLLNGLTFNFVEIAVKRVPKARDALFFQQLVTLRHAADATEEQLEALRVELLASLERLEGYQPWTEMLAQLKRLEAGVEGIVYRITQVGTDVQAIFPKLEEIARVVRGLNLAAFTTQGDQLVVHSRPALVMLREQQTYYFERHRLFAGRSVELMRIREFLQQRRRGYIFVTGPSGYGKTALLANLVAPKREHYVWYFLNRLDNTHRRKAFLRQMCEQLLAYYRIPVQSEADLPEAEDRLMALYSDLLRTPLVRTEQPLVVMIDGIDEAEPKESSDSLGEDQRGFIGEEHIPRDLPDGKFIIFSARQTGRNYPRELGLPEEDLLTIPLGTLDTDSIQALLQAAGGKARDWADVPFLCAQIQRVSNGDPFYLRYLVEDVAKGQITPLEIARQPAGLEAYLDGWWQQVVGAIRRDQDVRNLMGILMVVHGTLPSDDLFRLYPELEWGFDEVLKQVRRFVVVHRVEDGQAAYALCHPRFRDYLAEHKLSGKVPTYQEQMLAYCAGWPKHHSHYALRYYAAHLQETKRWRELFALARDEAFRHGQTHALPKVPDLPLLTVQIALQGAAEIEDVRAMAEFMLAHAWRLREITQESPITALRQEALERAWELADLYTIERCALWHLLLAWELNDTGKVVEARITLERLLTKELPRLSDWEGEIAVYLLVHTCSVNNAIITALDQRHLLDNDARRLLCKHLTARNYLAMSLQIANGIDEEWDREEALQAIAEAQARARLFAPALETAQGIGKEWQQVAVLCSIAAAQVQAGEREAARATLAMALKTARGIGEEGSRAVALERIAAAQVQAGEREAAQATFAMALKTACGIIDHWERAQALRNVAAVQVQSGRFAAALLSAQRIAVERYREEALQAIAEAQAGAGQFAAALKTAQGIAGEGNREEVLWVIAKVQAGAGQFATALETALELGIGGIRAQARAGQFAAALETAQGIGKEWDRAVALGMIAERQVQAGETEAAQATFAMALKDIRALPWASDQEAVLRMIAAAQVRAGWSSAAIEIACGVPEQGNRAAVLRAIAEAQVQAGEMAAAQATFAIALKDVRNIDKEWDRTRELKAIAEAQVRARQFATALETAQGIGGEWQQAAVLHSIAAAQVQVGETEAAQATIDHALEIAQRIQWEKTQAATQGQIAVIQARAGEMEAGRATFTAALETAQRIGGEEDRAEALRAIAEAQAQAGEMAAAQATFFAALKAAKGIVWGGNKAEMLRAIAEAQAQAGQFAAALETARTIEREGSQAEALRAIAEAQVQAGETEAARATFATAVKAAQGIAQEWDPEPELSPQAETRVVEALGRIAVAQAQAGETAAARAIFATALETARTIERKQDRLRVLRAIVVAQARAGEIDAAQAGLTGLETAQTGIEESDRAQLLREIAVAQAQRRSGEQAVRTAGLLSIRRNWYLPEIAEAFVKVGDREHFKRLLIPCAYYLDAAYQMCGLLAQVYPAHATAIALLVQREWALLHESSRHRIAPMNAALS